MKLKTENSNYTQFHLFIFNHNETQKGWKDQELMIVMGSERAVGSGWCLLKQEAEEINFFISWQKGTEANWNIYITPFFLSSLPLTFSNMCWNNSGQP
jgi:hypothetical protein